MNSNVLLANIASAGTIALAEDIDEAASLNSESVTDSSYTTEAFSLFAVGDMISKQYLYGECNYIAHHIGF